MRSLWALKWLKNWRWLFHFKFVECIDRSDVLNTFISWNTYRMNNERILWYFPSLPYFSCILLDGRVFFLRCENCCSLIIVAVHVSSSLILSQLCQPQPDLNMVYMLQLCMRSKISSLWEQHHIDQSMIQCFFHFF